MTLTYLVLRSEFYRQFSRRRRCCSDGKGISGGRGSGCVKPVQVTASGEERKTADLWCYPGAGVATRRGKVYDGRERVVGHCCRQACRTLNIGTLNIISSPCGGVFATPTKSLFRTPVDSIALRHDKQAHKSHALLSYASPFVPIPISLLLQLTSPIAMVAVRKRPRGETVRSGCVYFEGVAHNVRLRSEERTHPGVSVLLTSLPTRSYIFQLGRPGWRNYSTIRRGRGVFLETACGESHTRLSCIHPQTFVHGDRLLARWVRAQPLCDGHRQRAALEG
jgi:hypothetical protein